LSDHNVLIDDLWDYQDPAGTERKFRTLLSEADEFSDLIYSLTLLTQLARAAGLQGKFEEANKLLDQVENKMEPGSTVEVRYLLERGRVLNSSKMPAAAVPLFQKAVETGKAIQADFYVVDALHMLGIAAPPEERLEWNRAAIAYAEESPDPRAQNWLGSLLNNTGWVYFDRKDYKQALALFEKTAVFFREKGNRTDREAIARWSIGKTLRMLQRVDEALALQQELAADQGEDGFIEEEIAECLLALGDREAARPYFQLAFETLSKIDWVAEDTARMERLRAYSE
jgi:tetratricopeptide (TPR) repeat protein